MSNLSQEDRWKKLQEWKQHKHGKQGILKSKENNSVVPPITKPPVAKQRRATEHTDTDKETRLKLSVNRLQQELSDSQTQLQELQAKSINDTAEITQLKAALLEKSNLVKQYAIRYVPETLLKEAEGRLAAVLQDVAELNDLLTEAQVALEHKTISEMDLVTRVSSLEQMLTGKDSKLQEVTNALVVTLEDNEKMYMYIEEIGSPKEMVDCSAQTLTLGVDSSSQTLVEVANVQCQTASLQVTDTSTQVELVQVDSNTQVDEHQFVEDGPIRKKAKYHDEDVKVVPYKLVESADPDMNLQWPKNQAFYAFGAGKSIKSTVPKSQLVHEVKNSSQDQYAQTDQEAIYIQAENAVRECATMKFGTEMMKQQMTIMQQQHREELQPLKKDAQKIQLYKEELTKHQRRLKQLLETKAQDEQRIKELEQLVQVKQQENQVLLANLEELVVAVQEDSSDEE